MEENTVVYEWEDAIKYIKERCDLSEEDIEMVLQLEEGYMRKVGIIQEEYHDVEVGTSMQSWCIDGQQRTENLNKI